MYYTPSENDILKQVFAHCSKAGTGLSGRPDRILFDEMTKVLIVIECKAKSLQKAEKDLRKYRSNMNFAIVGEYKVWFVAFVSKINYRIFDADMNYTMKILHIRDFVFKGGENMSMISIEKEIHKLHDYLRDNTKVSNEDKGLFVALILICTKKPHFRAIYKEYDKFLYDLMEHELRTFDLDISLFEFLRNDNNNEHLRHIIGHVISIVEVNPSVDMLNRFYSEFVKYNNKDGKRLGIVLTPDYIVSLMIDMLEIEKDDVFLDLCTATGSFPLKALERGCKKAYACEFQNKLHTLLRVNLILREIPQSRCETFKEDCFRLVFTATKSAINPPYAQKQNELTFVMKQLQSVVNGGLVVAVIPSTTINNTKFLKDKRELLNIATPLTVINLNKDVFYPYAAVQCSIILLKKTPYNNEDVLFLNYEDDGYTIEKHKGRVQQKDFYEKYEKVREAVKRRTADCPSLVFAPVSFDSDWNYHFVNTSVDFAVHQYAVEEKMMQLNACEQIQRMQHRVFTPPHNSRLFALSEVFTIESAKRVTLQSAKSDSGKVPYISASAKNNGVTAWTSTATHSGPLFTLANSGSVGSCFFHSYDVCATDSVYILRLREAYESFYGDKMLMVFLACIVESNKVKYNFGRACRLNKISHDFLLLPARADGLVDFVTLQMVLNDKHV